MQAFHFILIVVIMSLLATGETQVKPTQPNELVIRGQVQSVKSEDASRGDTVLVRVNLSIEFANQGPSPILLLTDNAPFCPGITISTKPNATEKSDILYSDYKGPSVDTSPQWAALRKTMNQSMPPSEKTRLINPGESWKEDNWVVLHIPKTFDKYGSPPNANLQTLQAASPVFLRLQCEFWPSNIEPNPWGNDNKLGKRLQARWRRFGALQLETINSEPIKLVLSSALSD